MGEKKLPKIFKDGVEGTARLVEKSNSDPKFVQLNFRLEIIDEYGSVKSQIPIYVKAKEIVGRIIDGDEIVVSGKRKKNGPLLAKAIYNLSTDMRVILKGSSFSFIDFIFEVIFSLSFFAGGIGIFAGIILCFAQPIAGLIVLVISFIVTLSSNRILVSRKIAN